MFITCSGIFDQFLYLFQEFRPKIDTLKNGTSRIGLYGSPPGQRINSGSVRLILRIFLPRDLCGTLVIPNLTKYVKTPDPPDFHAKSGAKKSENYL